MTMLLLLTPRPCTSQNGAAFTQLLRRDVRPGRSVCHMYYTAEGDTVLVVESISMAGKLEYVGEEVLRWQHAPGAAAGGGGGGGDPKQQQHAVVTAAASLQGAGGGGDPAALLPGDDVIRFKMVCYSISDNRKAEQHFTGRRRPLPKRK